MLSSGIGLYGSLEHCISISFPISSISIILVVSCSSISVIICCSMYFGYHII